MIQPIKTIKSLYRANISGASKRIQPGSFPENYFMKDSPLAKQATVKKTSLSEFFAKAWNNLF